MFRTVFLKFIIVGMVLFCSTFGIVNGDELALNYDLEEIVGGEELNPPNKNILLLNSYNEGYAWTDSIVAAVEKRIQNDKVNANIDIEYMNAKQIYDNQYLDKLYELYKYKYSKRRYNVIIASDDDAYEFLVKYRDDLFPGVPVVYCGVNKVESKDVKEQQGFVGIQENTGFSTMVNMIRTIHPNVKDIFTITDQTATGEIIVKDIMAAGAKHPSICFNINDKGNIYSILDELSKLEENSVVVLTPVSAKDVDGNFLSIKQTSEKVLKYAKVPVYGLWDFYMGNGMVGSRIDNSSYQGDEAAKLALEILSGKRITSLSPAKLPLEQFVFDYEQLRKFNIKNSSLPRGSRIINRPINSINLSANMLWALATIFLCTLVFINILLLINIKGRKSAEEALMKSEGVIRGTLNATAEGLLVTSLDKKIIEYNAQFIRMWRFPVDSVEKQDVEAMFYYALKHLQDPEGHLEFAEQCYKQSEPAFDTIYLLDGRVFEVYTEALIIQGKMQGRVWSYKDITERKRAEMELQKSQERYKRLVELSPDAIFMAVDGRNVFINAAGLELLGARAEEEVYGRLITDFMYSNYSPTSASYLMGQAEQNKIFPLVEMKLKRMDNTVVDVETSTTAFDYDGHNAVLSVVRDITERKETELLKKSVEEKTKQLNEAWEYDKLKTEFFANISHELRTPINVILGAQKLFSMLLDGVNLGDKQDKLTKYIFMMRQNCYRLTRLVNNLIDITRIDAGFFNISLKNYDIINTVECITLSVADYVQEKGIELIFDTQLEERSIACDADKIERIMLNLLSNAVKFTNKGGNITVYIKEDGNYIVISVSDTGIGIPEEKLKTVFERFVQVDKSFIRNHEGSGIGLSIVKSLVDLHGGSIELTSEVDKGTTFEIRLPIVLVTEEEAAATSDVTYQSSAERINVEFSDIYFD